MTRNLSWLRKMYGGFKYHRGTQSILKVSRKVMSQPVYIAPRLRCGIGNRLFQTVAAIGAAERLSVETPDRPAQPVFFLPRMSHYDHGNFELIRQVFPTLQLIETAPEWLEVKETEDRQLPPSLTNIPSNTSLIVLSGFFQNTYNFPLLTNPHLPVLPRTAPLRDSWAIHFRFGDYLILPHYHVPLSHYYYYCVTKNIPKQSTITLFSDSPGRLPPISEELTRIGYKVEIYNNPDELETLTEFSRCSKGSICSNSTFAWWAAYFAWKNSSSSNSYMAFFPNRWILGRELHTLFTLPFTEVVDLEKIPASLRLESFSHS